MGHSKALFYSSQSGFAAQPDSLMIIFMALSNTVATSQGPDIESKIQSSKVKLE